MNAIEIKPDIYWVGVNDRKKDLFEGLWPVQKEGVSYNSYLIRDDKNILIDLASASSEDAYFDQIKQVCDPGKIDLVIINHMEPDHSGLLTRLRQLSPQVKFLATDKAAAMLNGFYGIANGIQVVTNETIIGLSRHNLRFTAVPMVHWPETMVTYEENERILFSCDAFGSYGAIENGIFDDTCENLDFYRQEGLRYYANIIASYNKSVLLAISKLKNLVIDVVAPSHGLVWRKNPGEIIGLYQKWADYAASGGEAGVTILCGTMYGNTLKAVDAVERGIMKVSLPSTRFDVSRDHVSYILAALWSQRGVVIGAPTYDGGIFPAMTDVLSLAAKKRYGRKVAARLGSYAWGGGAERAFNSLNEELKWELFESFDFLGRPTDTDLARGESLGEQFSKLLTSHPTPAV